MLTAVVVSCTTIPEPFGPPPEGAGATAVFYSRWVEYLDSAQPGSLQEPCRPRLTEPADNLPYRGTVVLFHGFTACPQQFFELAELLALRGYRSLLVVLPGHGKRVDERGRDVLAGLPVRRNWRNKIGALAAQVNGIMEYAGGDRVIGGLSAGATASLYTNLRAPDLYDRHILFAPMFAFNDRPMTEDRADVEMQSDFAREACIEKREQGRAGYCDYRASHRDALAASGRYTLDAVRQAPLAIPVQVIGIEEDTVASNAEIREFVEAQAQSSRVSVCFLPQGVPHEMISEHDFPGVEMLWLDSLLNGSIGFITVGRPLPVIGKASVSEAPYALCAMETERRD